MTPERLAAYLSRPFVGGQRVGEAIDCVGLAGEFYAREYGVRVNLFPEAATFASRLLVEAEWERVEEPFEGALAAVQDHNGFVTHVGIYLSNEGGSLLHAVPTGSTVTRFTPRKLKRTLFYRRRAPLQSS